MDEGKLQIRGYIKLISGGYDKEDTGAGGGGITTQFQDTPLEGEREITYFYRDATSVPATNDNSTRVDVKLRERWEAKKTNGNHYEISVKAWLLSIERCCQNGNPWSGLPTLTIQVYGAAGRVFGPKVSSSTQLGTIFEGNLYLGERKYDLGPQQMTADGDLSVEYINYTTGYWNGKIPSPYLDQIAFGLQFFNALPDECDPPKLTRVEQIDDICENYVDSCLTFEPCSCDGMRLRLEYRFAGENWESAANKGQYREIAASDTSFNKICLYGLPPTNHTNKPTIVYWRAKYVPDTSTMPETKYTESSFQTLFVLAPHETVPDISAGECSQLMRGDLIPKYDKEQCYNESSCADMVVRNGNREKDTEDCKKVNGVA